MSTKNWMSLRRRYFFWHALEFETNIKLPIYKFKYKNEKMLVLSEDEIICRYAGGEIIESGGLIFKSKFEKVHGKLGGDETLVSENISITLNRQISDAPKDSLFSISADNFIGLNARSYIEVSSNRNIQEKYLISSKKHSMTTNVAIESAGDRCDPQLMLACLVYVWTGAENSRRPY